MNIENGISKTQALLILILITILTGCAGQTGRVGKPIATRYEKQLAQVQVGKTTPPELKKIFSQQKIFLRETRLEGTKKYEVWELMRQGSMDAAQFILWGVEYYDRDQSLLFRFEDGILTGYESFVYPVKNDGSEETPRPSTSKPEMKPGK